MPLFEYRCVDCGNRFDRLIKHEHADDAMTCPSCGSTESRRLISVFATFYPTGTRGTEVPSASVGGCGCGGACSCGGH